VSPPDVASIAVFRALMLGDLLCAVPALRALRNAWPRARITLIGLPWASAFVERFAAYVDDLLLFPGAVGFPEQAETDDGLPTLYERARERAFDLAIQMHGSGGPANDIVDGLGARSVAGFRQPGERARTGTFIDWPDALPEPLRYLRLVQALGVAADDASLSFPLRADDEDAAERLLRAFAIDPARAVIVHPGAQWPSRRWALDRFAQVGDAVAETGFKVIITGTGAEAALADAVRERMRHPAVSLAGRTSLGALAALVARVRLVIANDTGISHVAAALRTPSVVVASGSDTRRWAPLDRHRHQVLSHDVACRPCAHPVCPVGHVCALGVGVDDVLAAVRAKLATTSASEAPALVA
jgi:ADP-heptose:LPS heptosyltransferase